MTTVISIIGLRGSGKTSMAIAVANLHANQGKKVGVFFEGPMTFAFSQTGYLEGNSYVLNGIKSLRFHTFDYIIYDGDIGQGTTELFNCSPSIELTIEGEDDE